MRQRLYQQQWKRFIRQRTYSRWILCGLVGLCLLLSATVLLLLHYQQAHARVYLVPPQLEEPFWLSQHAPSASYLAQMTGYLAQLRLSLTPNSVAHQHAMLLRYSDPQYHPALALVLQQEGDALTAQQMRTSFYPSDIVVDADTLSVRLSGELHRYLGDETLDVQTPTYVLRYHYQQGTLRLWAFFQEEVDDE